MNVIVKCEDQYDQELGNDEKYNQWSFNQFNPQAQPLKQIEQSTNHLESANYFNDTLPSSPPSSPPSITLLSAASATTTATAPFVGLSKFEEMTIEKNHHSHRLVDNPYHSLAQSYASIFEMLPVDLNHRRSNNNNFHPADNRITLPTIHPNSLDSASFIRRRNERERARVRNVNEGFDRLRKHLPLTQSQREKRLSKVETLRMAISYIKHLEFCLYNQN